MNALSTAWLLEKITLIAPLVFSLSVHELAHARTALVFGDPTARNMGRCTLNPLAHLDPIGTLSIFLCGFGWAKPVPINPHNLRPPKWGNIAVSLAGPLSNLMLGIVIALILRLLLAAGLPMATGMGRTLFAVSLFTMAVNICLFVFNMIPLYLLDGHHILREQLPLRMQASLMHWQMRYGRLILLALIAMPMVSKALNVPTAEPLAWVFRQVTNVALDNLILPA